MRTGRCACWIPQRRFSKRSLDLDYRSQARLPRGLSDRQYGFRPGLSTIVADRTVASKAEQTQQGNHYSRKICVAARLNVRNVFNSLRWVDPLNTLRDRFRVPGYLLRIMQNYLSDRVLLYDTTVGGEPKQ